MVKVLHIIISLIPALALRERLLLGELFTSAADLSLLKSSDIESILGRKLKTTPFKVKEFLPEAEKIEEFLIDSGTDVLWFWNSDYPPQLREIYDPPCLLYKRGKDFLHTVPYVSVVGTRYATEDGKKSAFLLGAELAEKSIPVVSGLALGIDSAVHHGVVKRNGCTVAVLGNGIDSIYPSQNRKLAGEILDNNGIIISEFPPGTPPLKYNFPKRNRIISGLSRAIVVVEAPEKSGALITADYALEQGRELFIHSCCLQSIRGQGSFRLSLDGAGILESAEDLIRFLGRDTEMLNMRVLDKPEDWSLSNLLEAELNGYLFRYEGTYFIKGGATG